MREQYRKISRKVFKQLGELIVAQRWAVIIVTVVLLGLFLLSIPRLRVITTIESSFSRRNKIIMDYQEFRKSFGRDEKIFLLIETEDVFNRYFLDKLHRFHRDLENTLPLLKDVSSLVNAPYLAAGKEELKVAPFLESVPQSIPEAEKLRVKADSYPAYKNIYYTDDYRYAVLVIKTGAVSALTPDGLRIKNRGRGLGDHEEKKALARGAPSISQIENIAILGMVETVIKEYDYNNFKIYYSGTPVYQYLVEPILMDNMIKTSIMVLILTSLFMGLLFRRVSGIFLPQFAVVASVVAALGLMALTGVDFTSSSTMLPSLILTIALPAPIHFMVVYFKYQKSTDRITAARETLEHSGLPIVMTAVTTVAGLLSFSTTEISPVADLGLFSAAGVFFSLLLTIFFLPAFLAVVKVNPGKEREKLYEKSRYNRYLMGLGKLGVTRPARVFTLFFIILAIVSLGIFKLEYSHNMLHYFSGSSDFMVHSGLIEKKTGGTRALEVVIDTKKENGVLTEEFLMKLRKLSDYALSFRDDNGRKVVGGGKSLLDFINEIRQLEKFKEVDNPAIVDLVKSYRKSGLGELTHYTDERFAATRLTSLMYWQDAASDLKFVRAIRKKAGELFNSREDLLVTGAVSINSGVIESLMKSLVVSYLTAFLVVTILMILSIGEVKLGLYAMIPNLVPLVAGLGLMGYLKIPLNTFNLIGGSIVIGIAVDDTIHFFHNFTRYFRESGSVDAAVEQTLASAGRALMTTTLIFVSCFWLRLFNPLKVVSDFGLITGFSLLVAFLADVLLAPALLKLVYERGRS
jgi:predicted RND superfamily exporter protein